MTGRPVPAARPAGPARGERAVEVFRSGGPRALAVVWWALSGFALVDIAVRGRDRESLVVALAILASDATVYLGAWRPGVRLHSRHLVVVGAFRDTVVRLGAITGADTRGALRIRVGSRVLTTATVTASARQSSRAAVQARQMSAAQFGGGSARGRGGRRGTLGDPERQRMDPQTLDAAVGATQAGYAASRIREEAERVRRAGEVPDPGPGVVTRWVWWPAVLALAPTVAAIVVATR